MNSLTIPLRPIYIITLLAGLQAFSPLSIDMYLPTLPQIAEELATSDARVQQSITSYLAGLFLGMLLFGPLSDKYGRRKLLLGGMAIYILACIGCATADSANSLIAWRFVQAIGGAAASILARTIVRDVFPQRKSAAVLSTMHLITMIATLAAPILGSFFLIVGSWRWLFITLTVFATLWLMLIAWKIPETHHGSSRSTSILKAFKAYLAIGGQRRALGYILCMSLCFAGMFTYITGSPFVFIDYFGLSPIQYALLFGSNIIGIMILTSINAKFVEHLGPEKMLFYGSLLCAGSSLTLILVGTFLPNGFWLLAISIFAFVSCSGMFGANCIAILMAQFPANAGAAVGLAVAVQFGLGAIMSFLVGVLYEGTPFAMALIVSLCGFGSVAALLLTRENTTAIA